MSLTADKTFLQLGHTKTLLAALIYFDFSFTCWVLLGPLGIQIAKALSLDPAHKGLIAVAIPFLALAQQANTQAETLGLTLQILAQFKDGFCETPRAKTLFSHGVNQSLQGGDEVNAIINVHLASGRIGRPGQGPFSLSGQSNAMGGREVGGLANQLATHTRLESPTHRALVTDFWQAPHLAPHVGLKAFERFDARPAFWPGRRQTRASGPRTSLDYLAPRAAIAHRPVTAGPVLRHPRAAARCGAPAEPLSMEDAAAGHCHLGQACKADTNCASCKGDIIEILNHKLELLT